VLFPWRFLGSARVKPQPQPSPPRDTPPPGQRQHFAMVVRWDAAHVVMHGWQNRNRFFGDINTAENPRGFRDPRQAFRQSISVNMLKVKQDMIFIGANAAAFINFHRHGAAHDIA
jgi:hypothetical protein